MDLDQLKPLERADLICPEIRLLTDELIDAIGAEQNMLANLIADSVEMELGCEQVADSRLYPKLAADADRRLAQWLKRHIRPLAESRINERLASEAETGPTAEEEDWRYRAFELAGVR